MVGEGEGFECETHAVRQSYVGVGCFMRILSLEGGQGGLCDQHFVAVMFLLQFAAYCLCCPVVAIRMTVGLCVWGGGGCQARCAEFAGWTVGCFLRGRGAGAT